MSLLSCVSRILVGSYRLNFCDHSLISLIVGLTVKGIVLTVSEPLQLSAAMASREVFENVEVFLALCHPVLFCSLHF